MKREKANRTSYFYSTTKQWEDVIGNLDKTTEFRKNNNRRAEGVKRLYPAGRLVSRGFH